MITIALTTRSLNFIKYFAELKKILRKFKDDFQKYLNFEEMFKKFFEEIWKIVEVRGLFQKFCIADPFSTKNQQMDLKQKRTLFSRL